MATTYHKYRLLGLCVECGRGPPKLPSKTRCGTCLIKHRNNKTQILNRKVQLGVCKRCSNQRDGESSICSSCSTNIKLQRLALKIEVFNHYGGVRCTCKWGCIITDPGALTINHDLGHGNDHRREIFNGTSHGGSQFYAWLKRNNYPPGYSVQCFNCNITTHIYGGECYHARLAYRSSP